MGNTLINMFILNLNPINIYLMKKSVLFLSIFISLNGFSQIQKPISKGNFIIDGGASFGYSKSTSEVGNTISKNSTYIINLFPTFAYFVVDNLAIGLSVPFNYGGSKNSKSYAFGLGPIVKYYLSKGPFFKMSLFFSNSKSIGNDVVSAKILEFEPGIGFAFFINPKVSIEPSLNYSFAHYKSGVSTSNYSVKDNNIKLQLGITVFI